MLCWTYQKENKKKPSTNAKDYTNFCLVRFDLIWFKAYLTFRISECINVNTFSFVFLFLLHVYTNSKYLKKKELAPGRIFKNKMFSFWFVWFTFIFYADLLNVEILQR